MELDECYKKNLIKKTRVNENLIKSLVEMSEIKKETVLSAKINEKNISAYFSLAYDSLREILEGVCISFGYKVTSHVCIGELLKKLIVDFNFAEFDRLRYARNGVNYYGTKIDFNQGKLLIKKCFGMRNWFLKKLNI